MKRLAVPIIATALLLGAPTAVSADPLEGFWPEPSTLSAPDAYGPDIAVSADGQRQAAIWTVYKSNDHRVQVATSSDRGATWTAATDLASTGNPLGNTSVVSSDNGQRLTVAWFENSEVHVRQSADGGTTWSAMVDLSPTSSIPRLTSSADGTRVTVVWTVTSTYSPVYASTWTAGVGTWSTPAVVSPPNEDAQHPSVSASADGQVVTATWQDGSNRLRAATSTNGGLTWPAPKDLSTAGLPALLAEVQTAADGSRIVATWVEGDDGFTVPNHVASSYSTDAGQTWSPPHALPQWLGNWAPDLTATADATGLTVVWPWQDDQGDVRARIASSTDGGVTWQPPVNASPDGVSVSAPMLAGSTDGQRLTVFWSETPASNTSLHAAVSGDAGATWSAPKTLSSSPGYDYPDPQIAAAPNGTPSAVWQQGGSSPRIKSATGQLATLPGAPTSVAATAGDGQAGVSWSPPATDGGSAVTSYTATAAPGGASCSTAGTSCTITGLANGTDYTIRVTATNAVGTGPASAPVAVRPAAPIVAPPSKKKLKATAKVKAVKRASRLRVRVTGDPGAGQQWRFVVQKRPTWRTVGTYSTRGPSHVRTLNLPKGTYRVQVKPANGYTGSVSQKVRLKR